jgi:Zn-dependent metalloprotease
MVSLALLSTTAAFAGPNVTSAARATAESALLALQADGLHARAVWRRGQTGPSAVLGLDLEVPGMTPAERARSFLALHADLVGVPAESLAVDDVRQTRNAVSVRLTQRHDNTPVFGREVVVSMDKSGKVIAFTSSATRTGALKEARIDEVRARSIAQEALEGLVVTDHAMPFVISEGGESVPALGFLASQPKQLRAYRVLVDLHAGTVIGVRELTQR